MRTTGADGGVDACDGPAIGLDLESILSDGLPPVNVTLEIIASLCEILDIADQDGEVHGAVHPKFVFIDETGANTKMARRRGCWWARWKASPRWGATVPMRRGNCFGTLACRPSCRFAGP